MIIHISILGGFSLSLSRSVSVSIGFVGDKLIKYACECAVASFLLLIERCKWTVRGQYNNKYSKPSSSFTMADDGICLQYKCSLSSSIIQALLLSGRVRKLTNDYGHVILIWFLFFLQTIISLCYYRMVSPTNSPNRTKRFNHLKLVDSFIDD